VGADYLDLRRTSRHPQRFTIWSACQPSGAAHAVL
jgi:hypothetical protein